MEDYYRRRASQYEEIYHRDDDPERREELGKIAEAMYGALRGRDVLEVACGTGFWTELLSRVARSVTAIDVADEVLAIAKTKSYSCPVKLVASDAYSLSAVEQGRRFDGALVNFWISHVPRGRLLPFLHLLGDRLEKGSRVFLADNTFVHGVGGELVRREDDPENTYKRRQLKDGSIHLVLKNYYTRGELERIFARDLGADLREIFFGKCYWFLSYLLG